MRTSTSAVEIHASPEAVWHVVTDPTYVERWQYGSTLSTDWRVGSGIRFSAEWDGQLFEQWGTVLAVERPAELSYTLFAPRPGLEDRPENYFTMTYRLTADGAGTTTLAIIQQDPRASAEDAEEPDGAENPVLLAVKELAESLPGGVADRG